MAKEKYEISLWEDEFVTGVAKPYFKERKIAIIGSDTMTASCRAFEPQLVENINGTVKFTFKMLYTCRDDTFEDLVKQFCVQPDGSSFYGSGNILFLLRGLEFVHNTYQNPFLNLLINERKVKVFWKDKWYDLIIKNCQEDSEKKTITYTCNDIFINELSKTGFDIQLDNELENNTGTITELANVVLENTDWIVDEEGSDLLRQTREEATYEVKTLHDIDMRSESELVYTQVGAGERFNPGKEYYYLDNGIYRHFNGTQFEAGVTYYTRNYKTITIPSNSPVLVYYNPIQDIIGKTDSGGRGYYLQLAYTSDFYDYSEGGQLVTNALCYSSDNILWAKAAIDSSNETFRVIFSNGANTILNIDTGVNLSDYRAERLVRTQRIIFDPLTNKYCNIYTTTSSFGDLMSEGDTIYKYSEIQYRDPTTVNNLVVNNKNFTSVAGWSGDNLTFQLYPTVSSITPNPHSYLKFTKDQNIYNSGLRQLSNYIPDGFAIGESYIFRYKAVESDITDPSHPTPSSTYVNDSSCITPLIDSSTTSSGHVIPGSTPYFTIDSCTVTSDSWVEFTMTCTSAISRADIYTDNVGIFFCVDSSRDVWLEQAEFFPEVYGEDPNTVSGSVRINPGDLNITSVAAMYYCYYNHTVNANAVSADDITYLWRNTRDLDNSDELYSKMRAIYNDDFEKIRTVSIKQSNRYNLLQKLAETFECWIEFVIAHNSDGSLVYENGVPKKSIRFRKENGQKTGIGFVYGIDLKTIQRTIQSDQIVTKMVVSPNKNQFAENGFCTIARSKENPSHNNFIFNFDYYISQNLLDKNITEANLNRYYTLLNIATNVYNQYVQEESAVRTILLKQKSYLTLYDSARSSAAEQIIELKSTVMRILDLDTWEEVLEYINDPDYQHSDEIDSRITAICALEQNVAEYESCYAQLSVSVANLQTRLDNTITQQNGALAAMKQLHIWFYGLYSRFIQEGSWIDESYTDDDLYYLDALKNSRISARPKVSYNISVLRLSSLDEFKAKIFHLGDITYIQDTEFFGYTTINGVKTPYREIVLLSEITSNFDEPEKDSFKIQNYKTEFEDLFQRINNTSQSFHYSAGGYDRINSTINTNGTIREKILQDSINAGNFSRVTSNEQIIQTPTEFIVSDVIDSNKKTKITAGGIFITENGGQTWKNALCADGIQLQALAPGVLDASKIGLVYKDESQYVKIGQGGIQMTGSSGDEGISYIDGNKVQGKLNYLSIYDNTATRALDATDELQFSNNEIQHYFCDGTTCALGGHVAFDSSGVDMLPLRGGTTKLGLKNKEILLQVDNGNVIFSDINPKNERANYLTLDLTGGKMSYTWYDTTLSSQLTSVLNLKTFTT